MTRTSEPVVNYNAVEGTPLPPSWAQGPPGVPGPPGSRGSYWWEGSGPPGGWMQSQSQDLYLDTATGDVYAFS